MKQIRRSAAPAWRRWTVGALGLAALAVTLSGCVVEPYRAAYYHPYRYGYYAY